MTRTASRRESLTAADLDDLITRAARATPEVPGLADFAWWPAESVEAAEVRVYSREGAAIVIPFVDIIPEPDGVFFFGWDVESGNAIWKWVPVTVSETQSLRWPQQKRMVTF